MKGLIAYSSMTGNTKKYAEKLAEGLADLADWTVADIKTNPDAAGYDVVLAGAWVDRSDVNKQASTWIDTLAPTTLGIFGTLGASPDSDHGHDVRANLEKYLAKHNGLGVKLLPGLVNQAVLKQLDNIPAHIVSPELKEQMIEISKISRWATEEEYAEAVAYFKNALADHA